MSTTQGLTYAIVIKVVVNVKLEGKYIGDIKNVDRGYAYFPKGKKEHGDVFNTVDAVKGTL